MARVIFDNLSMEQAEELARWYNGAGDQQADDWFDCRNIDTPFVKSVQILTDKEVVIINTYTNLKEEQ